MDPGEQILDFLRRRRRSLPKLIGAAVALVLVLLVVFSSWFQVETDSVGLVMRFGKHVRTVEPGLHYKLPFGIEEVRQVPVQKQLKEEFGFRTETADVRSKKTEGGFEEESLMVTGDLNVVEIRWSVQFRIRDAEKYEFHVRRVRSTFRAMTQAVMREIAGDRTVSEVLTVGRSELSGAVEEKVQDLCDRYETGIHVQQVILQDITPPDPVKPSFNEVNEAQQEREKLINQAKGEYNKAIPRAKGEAKRTIQKAEGYEVERVNRAEGEVARFDKLREEYEQAPRVTRTRLYLEALNDVLPQVKRKVVVDEGATDVIPLLPSGVKLGLGAGGSASAQGGSQ